MDLIYGALSFILSFIGKILPVFGFSESFLGFLDSAISFMISLLQTSSFFLPLDVLMGCLIVILAFDNWTLMFRLGQFIIKLVRG